MGSAESDVGRQARIDRESTWEVSLEKCRALTAAIYIGWSVDGDISTVLHLMLTDELDRVNKEIHASVVEAIGLKEDIPF